MFVGSRSSPRRVAAAVATTLAAMMVATLVLFLRPHSPAPSRRSLRLASTASLPLHSNALELRDRDYIPGWPFGVRINERDTCSGHSVYLLNAVTSNPSQVYHRDMIRKMWGSAAIAEGLEIRTVFIIGAVPSEVTQRHLQEESERYHDIIQFDFLETRKNLTLKSLAALHWFREYCSNATWVLKCDVDAYVNFWALLEVLRSVEATKEAVCARSRARSVCREASAMGCLPHYVVSREEYPPPVYPPYCQGYAYVLHKALVDRMLETDQRRVGPPLWIEDVYVTGLLPRDLRPRWLDVRRRSMVVPEYIRPEYHNGTFLFIHDLEGQIGEGATSYVWKKTLQKYSVVQQPDLL